MFIVVVTQTTHRCTTFSPRRRFNQKWSKAFSPRHLCHNVFERLGLAKPGNTHTYTHSRRSDYRFEKWAPAHVPANNGWRQLAKLHVIPLTVKLGVLYCIYILVAVNRPLLVMNTVKQFGVCFHWAQYVNMRGQFRRALGSAYTEALVYPTCPSLDIHSPSVPGQKRPSWSFHI